jgi:hypothetical protein
MEAPPPPTTVGCGPRDTIPHHEEEAFYVGADVKLFLSSLRPRRSLLLSIPHDLSGLRLC